MSSLIKEVAVGIGSQQTIVEARVEKPPQQDFSRQRVELQEEARSAMAERKRKLEASLGGGERMGRVAISPVGRTKLSCLEQFRAFDYFGIRFHFLFRK